MHVVFNVLKNNLKIMNLKREVGIDHQGSTSIFYKGFEIQKVLAQQTQIHQLATI